MKTQKKRLISAGVIICVILFTFTIVCAVWCTYGGHNIRMAVAEYVEANDGKWPQSWDDIEEYHTDPVIRCQSTVFVRQYWSVAWHINPVDVAASEEEKSESKPVSVVYKSERISNPDEVKRWDLGKRITQYYRKKNEVEQVVVPGIQ